MPSIVINNLTNGYIYVSGTSYATVQGAATGNLVQGGVLVEIANDFDNPTHHITRGAIMISTTALGASVTISAAVLSIYGHDKNIPDGDFNITVVSGTGLSGTTLVDTDYGDLLATTTSYGSISGTAFTLGAWNNITLNAAGIAAITKGGTTRFGFRSSRDIAVTPSTGFDYVQFETEVASTAFTPYITITYTPMSAGNIGVIGSELHYIGFDGIEYKLQGN